MASTLIVEPDDPDFHFAIGSEDEVMLYKGDVVVDLGPIEHVQPILRVLLQSLAKELEWKALRESMWGSPDACGTERQL